MFDFDIVLEGRETSRLKSILGDDIEYPVEFPKPVSLSCEQTHLLLFKKAKQDYLITV